MSRTKIVATLGPATMSPAALKDLVEAGMDIARLNCSHADLDWHRRAIRMIRDEWPAIPILLDMPGRKVRTAELVRETPFRTGDTVVLTTGPEHDDGEKIPVDYDRLHEDVRPGTTILADDGTLRFTVVEVAGRDIICRAETDGTLRSRKGINVPGVRLSTELLTDNDRRIIQFARENEADFIGVSFVESARHVAAVRELIDGSWPRIVAKIENETGMNNLDEVAEAADVVMIDRGDLSAETSLETLTIFQKRIIQAGRRYGKPVIVATEMLHSMIDHPFPTKAEISDITNAVIDGCAATMLSGETAIGRFPTESVSMMRRIADAAANYHQDGMDEGGSGTPSTIPRAVEDAIALICRNIGITKIVAVTISGFAARMLAARRPRQPILAVSNDAMAARSFNIYPGTEGVFVDIPFPRDSTDHIATCLHELRRRGKLVDDDLVLVTAVGYPRSGNRMNLIQTHHVRDLAESLNWN